MSVLGSSCICQSVSTCKCKGEGHIHLLVSDNVFSCLSQKECLKSLSSSECSLHAHIHKVQPPCFTSLMFQSVSRMNGIMNFKHWLMINVSFLWKVDTGNLLCKTFWSYRFQLWCPWRSSHLRDSLDRAKNQRCKKCCSYNSHFILKSKIKNLAFSLQS